MTELLTYMLSLHLMVIGAYSMQARSLIKELKLDKLVEIGLLNCSVNKVGNLNTVFRL